MAERRTYEDGAWNAAYEYLNRRGRWAPDEVPALAQHIQNAVEEWFAAREADRLVSNENKGA